MSVNTGQYISAAGHFSVIAYAMFGGLFLSPNEVEPVQVQEVSILSEADFAAMQPQATAPELPNVAPQITAPEISQPQTEPLPDAGPEAESEAGGAPSVEPSSAQDITAPPPEPVPSVEPAPALPLTQPSFEDPGAGLPDIPDQAPKPRPIARVAPEAVINPEPSTDIAAQVTPEISDQADAPAPELAEETPAAAPREAVTEIVTEADTPSGLSRSPRPKSRPAAVVAAARAAQDAEKAARAQERREREAAGQASAQADQAEAAASAAADAAAALIAEAIGETPAAPSRPVGPPLTGGERNALRVAVSQCWNTGSMSTEAQRTTITVGLDMNPDGTPQNGSIRLIGSSGGSSSAAEQAFQTARRAIIICGKQGFPLPADKFNQWQSIEMTFDPEQMRFK